MTLNLSRERQLCVQYDLSALQTRESRARRAQLQQQIDDYAERRREDQIADQEDLASPWMDDAPNEHVCHPRGSVRDGRCDHRDDKVRHAPGHGGAECHRSSMLLIIAAPAWSQQSMP